MINSAVYAADVAGIKYGVWGNNFIKKKIIILNSNNKLNNLKNYKKKN